MKSLVAKEALYFDISHDPTGQQSIALIFSGNLSASQ